LLLATPDPAKTPTAIAVSRSETAEAAAASTALAATGTPVVLGPWRSPEGHLAARVELWPCPTDESLAVTMAAAGVVAATIESARSGAVSGLTVSMMLE
jgi:hypothetical protein